MASVRLREDGIQTIGEMRARGAIAAFRRLRQSCVLPEPSRAPVAGPAGRSPGPDKRAAPRAARRP
jgi:hypothetical protein